MARHESDITGGYNDIDCAVTSRSKQDQRSRGSRGEGIYLSCTYVRADIGCRKTRLPVIETLGRHATTAGDISPYRRRHRNNCECSRVPLLALPILSAECRELGEHQTCLSSVTSRDAASFLDALVKYSSHSRSPAGGWREPPLASAMFVK